MIRLLATLAARFSSRQPISGQEWLHPKPVPDPVFAPTISVRSVLEREAAPPSPYFRGSSKPYTRWWWLAGRFRREDVRSQLEWLHANGFGGVELAWLWPTWMDRAEPGIPWLGPEWADLVTYTKQEADRLG